jgi:hypothetical protein
MTRWAINPVALAGWLAPDEPLAAGWPGVEAVLDRVFGAGEATAALRLLQEIADTVDKPVTIADALASPATRAAIDRHPRLDWRRIVALIAPVVDAHFTGGDATPTAGGTDVAAYRPANRLVIADLSYRDPVQGNAADCYLVASMIAIAWAAPRALRETLLAAAADMPRTNALACTFHEPERGVAAPLAVSTRVPFFAKGAGEAPLYATSSDRDEDWPSLLEKAFVMHHAGLAGDPQPADYVAIGADDGRLQPQVAARKLIGGREAMCCNAVNGGKAPSQTLDDLVDKPRGVTRIPAMAWTWRSGSHFLQGFDLATAGLLASHAYAVLGRFVDGGVDHVVLRNPHGRNIDVPAYSRGPWRPGPGATGADDVELNTDGVFALPAEWFDRCFGTVGWVDAA